VRRLRGESAEHPSTPSEGKRVLPGPEAGWGAGAAARSPERPPRRL